MNKFTVVVPTRERSDTLFHTLRTCVDQDYENLTILVSDNCSADNTEEVVKSFNDKRIQYIKTPNRLSMSSNWDFALDHVKGGYVNFIGDDDGIIPGSFHILNQILDKEPVDAITSKDMAIYYWPGFVVGERGGDITVSLKPTYRLMDTKKYFKKSFDALSCIHLPQLYHGYVKTDLIQDLKKKHGNFFNGSSPDIYSGVVLGKVLSRHIFSDYPLTIHGLSHHSIGSSNSFKQVKGNPFEKFWTENNIPFHEKLVKSASMTIIYADAFLLAKKYVPEIPEADIKNIIQCALNEPFSEVNKEGRAALLADIEKIALRNNLAGYAQKIIKEQVVSYSPRQTIEYGFNPINEMLNFKTSAIGLQNVFDAYVFCKNMLSGTVYSYYDRPLNEPVIEYFKRGLIAVFKKLQIK